MSYVKLSRSKETEYLQENHPNAFLLLTQIAIRARRYSGDPDGLQIGEAYIGDYKKAGIESESKYVTAKNILVKRKHIEIIETCRNRKKSTTGTTTVGTKLKLLSSNVYDINIETDHDRLDDRITTGSRPDHEEQERIRKNKKEKKKENIAPNDAIASSPPSSPPIYFSFDTSTWENISADEIQTWKETYPATDIQQNLRRMADWLLSNKSKAPKSNFRSFITRWLSREQDKLANKAASNFQYGNTVDRRTRNIDNTPVSSPADGRF